MKFTEQKHKELIFEEGFDLSSKLSDKKTKSGDMQYFSDIGSLIIHFFERIEGCNNAHPIVEYFNEMFEEEIILILKNQKTDKEHTYTRRRVCSVFRYFNKHASLPKDNTKQDTLKYYIREEDHIECLWYETFSYAMSPKQIRYSHGDSDTLSPFRNDININIGNHGYNLKNFSILEGMLFSIFFEITSILKNDNTKNLRRNKNIFLLKDEGSIFCKKNTFERLLTQYLKYPNVVESIDSFVAIFLTVLKKQNIDLLRNDTDEYIEYYDKKNMDNPIFYFNESAIFFKKKQSDN